MSSSKYMGFSVAYFGINGTGKTHDMLQILKSYKRNVLIVLFDDSEEAWDNYTVVTIDQVGKFKGQAVIYLPEEPKEQKEFWKEILEYYGRKLDSNGEYVYKANGQPIYEGGILLIDDAGAVLSTRDVPVMKIYKLRRQRKLDILSNFHGVSEYPVSLVRNTTHFVIKKTTDSTDHLTARGNKVLMKMVVDAINYVNEKHSVANKYFTYEFNLLYPELNKPLV